MVKYFPRYSITVGKHAVKIEPIKYLVLADLFYSSGRRVWCVSNNTKYIFQFVNFTAHA